MNVSSDSKRDPTEKQSVKFQLWELPARPDIATLYRTTRRQVIRNGADDRALVVLHETGRHLASRMPTARSLDGAARDAADESIKEKIIGDGHRHAGDQRRAHQFAPVEDIAADEVGRDAQRHRLLVRRRDESQGVDELL